MEKREKLTAGGREVREERKLSAGGREVGEERKTGCRWQRVL